ncbi:hypothetical protein V9L05_17270 [Bernardetia sp. Wsw4-3y2]|uniref:hypothetical protein n=1 Tax=Bernardetia sp. Wsw4-3y2 TaxID=3127471 RepID=UPI0030CD0088
MIIKNNIYFITFLFFLLSCQENSKQNCVSYNGTQSFRDLDYDFYYHFYQYSEKDTNKEELLLDLISLSDSRMAKRIKDENAIINCVIEYNVTSKDEKLLVVLKGSEKYEFISDMRLAEEMELQEHLNNLSSKKKTSTYKQRTGRLVMNGLLYTCVDLVTYRVYLPEVSLTCRIATQDYEQIEELK